MEKLLYSNRPKIEQDFIKRVCNYILSKPLEKKEESRDFCGIFVEGRPRQIDDLESFAALYSFNVFSQKKYPLFCFINNDTNFLNKNKFAGHLDRFFDNIEIIKIPEIIGLDAYTRFCIDKLYFLLPNNINNYIVTISPDSMFIKSGWEEKVQDFDYIGAPWLHMPSIEIFLEEYNRWEQFSAPTRIGNGGGSIRKITHCKRAAKQYGNLKLREKGTLDKFPTEDLFFSSIFKSVGLKLPTIEQASEIVIDPMDYEDFINKKSYMFHYFTYINPWKNKALS